MIIPYCNLLSSVFTRLIDENYSRRNSNTVDLSKVHTINTLLRFLAAEYICATLREYRIGGLFGINGLSYYPKLIIIPSYENPELMTYKVSQELKDEYSILDIDDMLINRYAKSLLQCLNSKHADIQKVLGSRASNYDVIWIQERYTLIRNIIKWNFIPESSYVELPKGTFIVDFGDYDVVHESEEYKTYFNLYHNHILHMAISSKLRQGDL